MAASLPLPEQHGALVQQRLTAGIGVDDPPVRVDQEHAGADAVEGIGQCRGFGGLAAHRRADRHGATHVRSDETHPLAHLVVDETLPLITKDAEEGNARARFFERNAQMVR